MTYCREKPKVELTSSFDDKRRKDKKRDIRIREITMQITLLKEKIKELNKEKHILKGQRGHDLHL